MCTRPFRAVGLRATARIGYGFRMTAREQLLDDLRTGRIKPERLVDLLMENQQQLKTALERIAELEKLIPQPPTPKPQQHYSLDAEEKRQQARGKKKKPNKKNRRGRLTTAEKIAKAQRHIDIYPEGVDPSECQYSHSKCIWQLENRLAILVEYRIFEGPKKQRGRVPGVIGQSEFSLEIILEIAFLITIMGLSFDKACGILKFFQNLDLQKSQCDALLRHLAKHWEHEFETLANLLANSAIVHADETGWSLKSVWGFFSEQARLLFFGVNKDGDTLKKILDPATFEGLLISDDAAVYQEFTHSQKCWAHLLRKAIKLALHTPENPTYRNFTDELLEIYRRACCDRNDGRLGDAGRERRVNELMESVAVLCRPVWSLDAAPSKGLENDFRLLVNEIMRLLLNEELFTFVITPDATQPNGEPLPAAGTNNEAERTLRGAAMARKTGRTSKTLSGARRQTIITSVLESLRVYLKNFTLKDVIEEVNRWLKSGQSCFAKLLKRLKIPAQSGSVLDRVYSEPIVAPSG
jgi:transposase